MMESPAADISNDDFFTHKLRLKVPPVCDKSEVRSQKKGIAKVWGARGFDLTLVYL